MGVASRFITLHLPLNPKPLNPEPSAKDSLNPFPHVTVSGGILHYPYGLLDL